MFWIECAGGLGWVLVEGLGWVFMKLVDWIGAGLGRLVLYLQRWCFEVF